MPSGMRARDPGRRPTATGELGKIAGTGMIVAFITSITVLPALLQIIKPPGEKEGIGFSCRAAESEGASKSIALKLLALSLVCTLAAAVFRP